MSAIFSMQSNLAYSTVLQVLPADQRWFAFDVPMAQARKGKASRFGMTLWNYHTGPDKSFDAWAITRDPATGDFWYQIRKERDGLGIQRNRVLLWDALRIAANMPEQIPMMGVLKDGRTRRCAPDHVFVISEVQMQADGSALWLRLEVPGGRVGTQVVEQPLPPMAPYVDDGAEAVSRVAALSANDYIAVRDAALQVVFDGLARNEAVRALVQDPGLRAPTAESLLNNFRCLVEGRPFKAPMQASGLQIFVDATVMRLGDKALPNAIAAIQGFVDYAMLTWGRVSTDISALLDALKGDACREVALRTVADAVVAALPNSTDPAGMGPSEILREVWVRGAQHAAFRRDLLRRWGGRCSVHGITCNGQLRASHIVAWRLDESVRADVNNGLLLSVPLDSLFDAGLISFDDDGRLLASQALDAETAKHFGVAPSLRIAWNHLQDSEREALRVNLARHREQHGASWKRSWMSW